MLLLVKPAPLSLCASNELLQELQLQHIKNGVANFCALKVCV
jgi:hypothetical protein